jgi:hypothetical protein
VLAARVLGAVPAALKLRALKLRDPRDPPRLSHVLVRASSKKAGLPRGSRQKKPSLLELQREQKGVTVTQPRIMSASASRAPKPLLQKGEVHKEKFDDDAERWAEVRGYLIIFFCNALSCVALFLYVIGQIDAKQELQLEILFLVFKCILEMVTGKFGWELMLHHTAMILGFALNQLPSMQCWAWITVHQQLVHVPFAIRALWRLTLPALGYVRTEFSWRRRGLINVFWISWMLTVGYRTPLILANCILGYYGRRERVPTKVSGLWPGARVAKGAQWPDPLQARTHPPCRFFTQGWHDLARCGGTLDGRDARQPRPLMDQSHVAAAWPHGRAQPQRLVAPLLVPRGHAEHVRLWVSLCWLQRLVRRHAGEAPRRSPLPGALREEHAEVHGGEIKAAARRQAQGRPHPEG